MNNYGIPEAVEQMIRARDTRCVYCGKQFSQASRSDWPTIEHLDEKPPFHWHQGLKENGVAICCWSCNSSRGAKNLLEWFLTPYCTDREVPINSRTVAEPVRSYLGSRTER